MQLTLLTLGLAATLTSAIPIGINRAGVNPAAAAPAAAPAQGLSSDGHQITNPAFDGAANFDLDALNAQSQGMTVGDKALAAAPAAPAANVANAALDDDASLAAEVSSIEKLWGKRDVYDDGEVDEQGEMDVSELEGDLEKRDPATLTAYLIYCLKHPKQCRAVKVH